jgi:hypothetical protein
MIEWPDNAKLFPNVRANLDKLRDSGPLRELDASKDTWRFESLPWSADYPFRLLLRNERREVVEVTLSSPGFWRIAPVPEEPHVIEPADLVGTSA